MERITRTKQLTTSNWLRRDDTLKAFVQVTQEGVRPLTKDVIARRILAIEVSPSVPHEARVLFRTAQATLLYGYFFYPLFALGQEQLTRVAEAALGMKFKELGGPSRTRNLKGRIDWMRAHEHLGEEEFVWWNATRELRNSASHLELQMLTPPGQTVGSLRRTAHAISCLFDPTLEFMSLWRSTEPAR